jgi:hypothetical protein
MKDINTLLTLKDKNTGDMYYVVDGSILTKDEARLKDVTASFLTLEHMLSGEQKLCMYAYFGPNPYEETGYQVYTGEKAKPVEYDLQENVITQDMLARAVEEAEKQVTDRIIDLSYLNISEEGPVNALESAITNELPEGATRGREDE